MKNQLGQTSFPRTYSCQGQPVTEFEDYLGFVLTDDYFRKAAEFDTADGEAGRWKQLWEIGRMRKAGISINKRIYKTLCKHFRRDDLETKPLIVYNVVRDEFYRLTDYDRVFRFMYLWTQQRKKLLVTPLDAYEEVDRECVPENVVEMAEKHR
jgi:hypothetical protein